MFDHLPFVRVLVVSYDEQEPLRKTLEDHRIEVILSTFGAPFPPTFKAQITLIKAAAEAASVKRFAPTEWLVDFEKGDEYALAAKALRHPLTYAI